MRKINLFLAYLSIVSVFILFQSQHFNLFWNIAWILFLIIVFSRPLCEIFCDTKIAKYLRIIVSVRQWLGIMCWVFAIAHWVWFFLDSKIDFIRIFSTWWTWNIKTLLWSWIWATIFILPPLITSHRFWMIELWRNWKRIQRFTYPAFILTSIHIGIARWNILLYIGIILIYIIIYILAYTWKKCPIPKKNI